MDNLDLFIRQKAPSSEGWATVRPSLFRAQRPSQAFSPPQMHQIHTRMLSFCLNPPSAEQWWESFWNACSQQHTMFLMNAGSRNTHSRCNKPWYNHKDWGNCCCNYSVHQEGIEASRVQACKLECSVDLGVYHMITFNKVPLSSRPRIHLSSCLEQAVMKERVMQNNSELRIVKGA